ncbi:MAG: hypothetical protein U0835_06320 [Isosphaeraceae bacterium]
MRNTAFLAGMETLERRDTPSGAVPYGLPPRVAPISGSGTATVAAPVVTGQFVRTAFSVKGVGQSGPLQGAFVGAGTGTLAPKYPAIASAVLTLANGDQVDVKFHGKVMPSKTPGVQLANLGFKLVDVGPKFSGATGNGTLTGTINVSTGVMVFTYRGNIRY